MTHGTLSTYRNHECRCEPCKRANTRYCKWYRLTARVDVATGRPAAPRTVSADPVHAHLVALVASGWSLRDISRESAVAFGSVQGLHVGRLRRPRLATAARILALEPLRPVDVDPVVVERLTRCEDWRGVPRTDAERDAAIRAMDAAGMSRNEIAKRTHLNTRTMYAALRAEAVA